MHQLSSCFVRDIVDVMRAVQHYSPDVVEKALELRRQGFIYSEIQKKLAKYNIPKNTISCWVTKAKIVLSDEQKSCIYKKQQIRLFDAQKRGAAWHRNQKLKRLDQAQHDVWNFLKLHTFSSIMQLFFLSGLYLGEGRKEDQAIQFANSNPQVIQCFLSIFRKSFPVLESKFGIQIHARFDQNDDELKSYWSTITNIPIEKIQKIHKDPRTAKSITYGNYRGVCAIYYYDAKIQRFMLELQKQCMEYVINT